MAKYPLVLTSSAISASAGDCPSRPANPRPCFPSAPNTSLPVLPLDRYRTFPLVNIYSYPYHHFASAEEFPFFSWTQFTWARGGIALS
jgi:hypothetical protein